MSTATPAVRTARDDEPLARMYAWAHLPEGERKRRATEAAHAYDATVLADLAIAYMETHGRCSRSTRRNYTAAIKQLIASWADASVPILRATATDAHAYVRGLEQRYVAGTARVHLAACQALYRALRWAIPSVGHPFVDARVRKRDNRLAHQRRQAFEPTEVQQLLDVAPLVDRVLILLAARAGLRMAEALALRWRHLDLDPGNPIVRVIAGKGGKDRDVEMPADLLAVLLAWQRERQPDPGDRVLPYTSATRARQRLERLHQRSGLPYVPGRMMHSLRHTYGTAVYETASDLSVAQDLLGHANIATTRGYTHRANRKRLRAAVMTLPAFAI